jgi:hypothetical protein
MCGGGPPPVYQGKTYRRERVSLNENTLSKYGGAWQNGVNGTTLRDSINTSQTLSDPVKSNSLLPNGVSITAPPKSYSINSHLKSGTYAADDGSFLSSTNGALLNRKHGIEAAFSTNKIYQQDTFRYVEDPNGRFGVKGYHDNGTPTDFLSLDGYDIRTTTGKTQQVLSKKSQEPTKQPEVRDNRRTRKGSVSTSSFRIELGTPSKSSGLRIPQ